MSRLFVSGLITSLLMATVPIAQGIPLGVGQMPQLGLGLATDPAGQSVLLNEALERLNHGERAKAKAKLAEFLKQYPNDPRGPELAGIILLEDKNYRVAAVSFAQALKLKPNNPGVLAKLGVALLLQDMKKEGQQALEKAIALRPGEPLARRYLGWLDEGRGNLPGAAQHYTAALKGGELPGDRLTELHLALGRIYSAQGRNEELVHLLAPLVDKADTSEAAQSARFQLAYAYINLNRNEADAVMHSLEKTVKADHPEWRLLVAYAQLGTDPSGARQKLQSLVKSAPAYAGRTNFLIARSYAMEGKTAQAATELEALAAKVQKGDLPEVLTALAALYVSSGQSAKGISVLDLYARKHPDIVEISYLLAEVRFQSGDLGNAETLLKQIVLNAPNYGRAYALLGQIERHRNALSLAEEHLRKAVALDKNLATSWVNLAGVYVDRKEPDKAVSILKQGLAANPGQPLLQYELANLYDSIGKASDANPLYKTVLTTYTNYVPALNGLALNLAESGDVAQAKTYAERAYAIDQHNSTTQDIYGWILVLNKETGKGLPLLQQALAALPNDPAVLYHLGAALVQTGKQDEGRSYLKRALATAPPENIRAKVQSLLK